MRVLRMFVGDFLRGVAVVAVLAAVVALIAWVATRPWGLIALAVALVVAVLTVIGGDIREDGLL